MQILLLLLATPALAGRSLFGRQVVNASASVDPTPSAAASSASVPDPRFPYGPDGKPISCGDGHTRCPLESYCNEQATSEGGLCEYYMGCRGPYVTCPEGQTCYIDHSIMFAQGECVPVASSSAPASSAPASSAPISSAPVSSAPASSAPASTSSAPAPSGSPGATCADISCPHSQCGLVVNGRTASYGCLGINDPVNCQATGCGPDRSCLYYQNNMNTVEGYGCFMYDVVPNGPDCRTGSCPGGKCAFDGNIFRCVFNNSTSSAPPASSTSSASWSVSSSASWNVSSSVSRSSHHSHHHNSSVSSVAPSTSSVAPSVSSVAPSVSSVAPSWSSAAPPASSAAPPPPPASSAAPPPPPASSVAPPPPASSAAPPSPPASSAAPPPASSAAPPPAPSSSSAPKCKTDCDAVYKLLKDIMYELKCIKEDIEALKCN